VLPLENHAPDPVFDQTIAGLTPELISLPGQIPELRVLGYYSLTRFSQPNATFADIALALGAGVIVRGTVTRQQSQPSAHRRLPPRALDSCRRPFPRSCPLEPAGQAALLGQAFTALRQWSSGALPLAKGHSVFQHNLERSPTIDNTGAEVNWIRALNSS
jgi:hypothetical protein